MTEFDVSTLPGMILSAAVVATPPNICARLDCRAAFSATSSLLQQVISGRRYIVSCWSESSPAAVLRAGRVVAFGASQLEHTSLAT